MNHDESLPCETPHSELCDKALAYYEEISTAACRWDSLVPKAIEFYKLHGERVIDPVLTPEEADLIIGAIPLQALPAAVSPTTPSDAAMRAAEEIRTQFKARFVIPSEDALAAIITRHLPATVSSASVDREAAAKMAFDTVKAVLESNNQYSTLQVAAMAAANIRYLVPPLSACVNCGHSDLHDGPAGTVDDACTHEGCNCGYYTPSDQVAGIGYREAATATTSPETGWTPEEYRAKFCSETPVGGEAKICVKCKHPNETDPRGRCISLYYDAGGSLCYCGCKCELASIPITADSEVDKTALCTPVPCGAQPVFPAERIGCGRYITSELDLYRCVDCSTPFHRDCLREHFGSHESKELKQ